MTTSFMHRIAPFAATAFLALAAGCATTTPDERITSNPDAFSSWPADVQAEVRAGQAAIGFTPDQVLMALGEPESRSLATGPQGTQEIWFYSHHAARLSIGLGVGGGGGYHGGTAVGGGVSAGGIKLGHDSSGQIFFTNGRVSQIILTTS